MARMKKEVTQQIAAEATYLQYRGQSSPQPAYLSINTEDGSVDVGPAPGIGGTPARAWHNIDIRYSVSPLLNSDEAEGLARNVAPLALDLAAHSRIEWDGSNWIGILDEQGEAISARIATICEEAEGSIVVSDAAEWMEDWHGEEEDPAVVAALDAYRNACAAARDAAVAAITDALTAVAREEESATLVLTDIAGWASDTAENIVYDEDVFQVEALATRRK